jgi:CIC family chloride channel protein
VGAGIASACGRYTGLSRESLRLIAPVGAAAGLAAAFNSPITAVLFVIEEVIGTWSAMALGSIVLAAFSSVVVQHWFLGDQPLFRVPDYHLEHSSELVVYGVLGLAGGLVALLFVKLALALRPRLRALPRWTWFIQPAIAGLLIAGIATSFPQITGAGYEFIDAAMHDRFTWQVLGVLTLLKIVATVLSFSSGTPGGLFAPTLFIGAMLGGAVCGAARDLIPSFQGTTGAYALIGMGTMFAGIMRAPFTSVFMIVEVSGNYSIALPLMISNTIAYLVSRTYQREAIFDALAAQDGLTLPSMEQQRDVTLQRIEDAVEPALVVVQADERVGTALDRATAAGVADILAQPRPGVWTIVTSATLTSLLDEGKGALTVGSAFGLATPLPVVHPDQPLDTALRRLGDRPFLPVVHRARVSRLVGIVTLEGILRAYRATDL